MNQKEISRLAAVRQEEAHKVLATSGIAQVWKDAGCRVNLVGSLRMGLLATHRDIDLHVYSADITEASTFAIASRMSLLPGVMEITAINGLHTDEHCMAWHVKYKAEDNEVWKFDIIHIEAGTEYDGYFEKMADRIMTLMTPSQRDTILRLKFETPSDESIKGVEYYEAVIAEGVASLEDLRNWVRQHRQQPPYYWIP
ncbi:MAG: phosphoglycerate mutase family protein [Muribaculaceae bacterium]|nr:phosphoglycerate mutase family protein [Muribaculaceae bacterium]